MFYMELKAKIKIAHPKYLSVESPAYQVYLSISYAAYGYLCDYVVTPSNSVVIVLICCVRQIDSNG